MIGSSLYQSQRCGLNQALPRHFILRATIHVHVRDLQLGRSERFDRGRRNRAVSRRRLNRQTGSLHLQGTYVDTDDFLSRLRVLERAQDFHRRQQLPHARFLSVEKDETRVAAARRVFANHPNVEIIHGDAGELFDRAPFDLLVHDGGWGSGKNDPRRIDPLIVLKPNGVMTIDDYEPMAKWPPTFEGKPDTARIDWLTDPRFVSTEITVAEHTAVLVCRRLPS
jgi:hypothetical protein